ncbi:MAG: 3-hydroxyacyl-CoA dehydrogenase [Deltaproteobacteria bacterium]|nr:MAG: 3-hydroxyacyl-CoA dehydrogenase [Deltaproteobacteria bacterium]
MKGTTNMHLSKLGVVGGGIMGGGIIQVLLNAGFAVAFMELDQDLLDKALQKVEKIFRSAREKGLITQDEVQEKMGYVKGSTSYGIFSDADLVIEAVPERLEIKGEVFKALDAICRPEIILATNTSSLSISQLGSLTQRPQKVIGMHWFNPPHIMKLVEIVPGLVTSQDAVDTLIDLCKRLGKTPVQVKECAGFLVNRLLGIYVNEALFLVQERQSPQEVDLAAEGLGIPMGPLRLGEMVGWDTIYRANTSLFHEYGSRFSVPPLLAELYETEHWGSKAGKGLYQYERSGAVEAQRDAAVDSTDLSTRLLSIMFNEGIRCLDERVASSRDIDTALKVGAGMPKGPLQWTDQMGLDRLLNQLETFMQSCGERFLPAPLLRRKVAAGHLGRGRGIGFYEY